MNIQLDYAKKKAPKHRAPLPAPVGVSPAAVRKWLRRHQTEGVAGLRTSRPHPRRTRISSDCAGRSLRRNRQPFCKIAPERPGFPLSPVARIAKAKGPSRLSALGIASYERRQPGEMILTLGQVCADFRDLPDPVIYLLTTYLQRQKSDYGEIDAPADIGEIIRIIALMSQNPSERTYGRT